MRRPPTAKTPCWIRIFQIAGIIFLAWGFCGYLYQRYLKEDVGHFAFLDNPTNPSFIINIQYKTKGLGFYVGKEVDVLALIHTQNLQAYQKLTNGLASFGTKAIIANSEEPQTAKQELGTSLRTLDPKNPVLWKTGVARLKEVDGTNILLEGEVKLTKEGPFFLGLPIFNKPPDNGESINIGSSSVGDQIETNRLVLLLTFITLGLACLSLHHDAKENR